MTLFYRLSRLQDITHLQFLILSDFYQESDSHRTHASIQQRLQQHDRQYRLSYADDMTAVEIRHEIRDQPSFHSSS